MSNLEKYDEVFMTNFRVDREQLPVLTYQSVSVWDSVGHMSLVAAIEDSFNIMMDTEDIMGFSSYEEGKKIMEKYNISI
jgi:acyl carrier protein